jgi:hypothetical protein
MFVVELNLEPVRDKWLKIRFDVDLRRPFEVNPKLFERSGQGHPSPDEGQDSGV